MFEVNIYIETSLKGPGTRKGSFGSVIECTKKDGTIHKREDYGWREQTTYHRSVLLALIKALERLNTSCNLTIHTDSVFLINNVERGNLARWSENGFLKAKGEPVANREEWQKIDRLLKGHKFSFCYEKRNKYSADMLSKMKEFSENCG